MTRPVNCGRQHPQPHCTCRACEAALFRRNDGRHPCGHERQGRDPWLECRTCWDLDETQDRQTADSCPRCGDPMPDHPRGATSRYDNTTMVCRDCGMAEAILQFGNGGSLAALHPVTGATPWVTPPPGGRR
jgi:hypothetical protein